eukprot:Skav233798  [mRNA]  locus=scaffold780:527802:532529:+ [translate_table: standard]
MRSTESCSSASSASCCLAQLFRFSFTSFPGPSRTPCSSHRRPSRHPWGPRRHPAGICCRRSRWPRLVELLSGAPVVQELASDRRLLGQVCQHVLIQGSHRAFHVLGQLFPDLLHDVCLGLARHVLLRSEELLHAFHLLLDLFASGVVLGDQLS